MEYQYQQRKTRNQRRQRKFLEQKLIGAALLIISGLLVWMCAGTNEDCSAVLLTAPLGLLLLFSRNIWIV